MRNIRRPETTRLNKFSTLLLGISMMILAGIQLLLGRDFFAGVLIGLALSLLALSFKVNDH